MRRDRLNDALEVLRSEIFGDEDPLYELQRLVTDHDGTGKRGGLEPRRQVRSRAHGEDLRPPALAHVADHDGPRVDADSRGELEAVLRREALVERGQRGQRAERRPDRPFGVVLVGAGISEVDEQPVPQILGHVSLELLDHIDAHLLELANDVAPVLGVELRRMRGGSDQIAERHRDLTVLGFRGRNR